MAEARHARLGIRTLGLRQRAALADPRLDVRLGARRIADLEQHREHVFVGAAVTRALQRSHRRRQRGVHVGERGHRHARGERRRVELVIGDDDQRFVHRLHARPRRLASERDEERARTALRLERCRLGIADEPRRHHQRHEELGADVLIEPGEFARRDADHGEVVAVEADATAQDTGIRSELVFP